MPDGEICVIPEVLMKFTWSKLDTEKIYYHKTDNRFVQPASETTFSSSSCV